MIVQQDLLYRKQWDMYDDEAAFVNFMKWGLKGGILILVVVNVGTYYL